MTDRQFRDHLGVWPDIGQPPVVPFPTFCPRTFALIDDSTRWLEWDGTRWVLPDDAPPPPEPLDSAFTQEERTWAKTHPGHPLAAWVFHGCAADQEKHAALTRELSLLRKLWLFPPQNRCTVEGVTCTAVAYLGVGEYGERFRCDFSTPEYDFTWWTGANCFMHEGWTGNVVCTVVDHTVYAGTKKTVVQRCADPTVKRKRKSDPEATDES